MINHCSSLKEQLDFLESRGLKKSACEDLAQAILDRFKVKNKKLLDAIADEISKTGQVPTIKLYWDSKVEDLRFEVIG